MKNITNTKRKRKSNVVVTIVLTFFLILTLIPVYVMIVNSFKTQNQMLDNVLWFSTPLYFKNYAD